TGHSLTIAWDPLTGAKRWAALDLASGPYGVNVAFDETTAYVASGWADMAVHALDRQTGQTRWHATFDGGHGLDLATTLAVDGAQGRVIAGGASQGPRGDFDYVVAGFATADGAPLSHLRYDGLGHGDDILTGLAVSADGSRLFAGYSLGVTACAHASREHVVAGACVDPSPPLVGACVMTLLTYACVAPLSGGEDVSACNQHLIDRWLMGLLECPDNSYFDAVTLAYPANDGS
ncbi:MAG TPA: hypothetical protein VM681_04605, partial [Candidatus Thermoplasmatota archaeon]|nr:hypothetical protein [Candidatus Thermoplasmatota archaeon]